MNTAVLTTYGLEFRIATDSFNKSAVVLGSGINPVTGYIQNYLMGGNFIEFYEEELIPEINKAINGENFDPDGVGEIAFLRLGHPWSFLSINDGHSPELSIPSEHLKEIILFWVEFLRINNLEH